MLAAQELHTLDDQALMTAVRQGSAESFAHLYHRHATAAAAYARGLVRRSADEHDIVADAFLRVFGALSRGLGPQGSFRPYLLRAVRNAAYDRTRAERRLELTDQLAVLEGAQPFRDTAVEGLDREFVLRAFRSLPQRWQEVLWLTLIEELPVDTAASQLGINTNSLTSLAYRAREGLRQAYLRVVFSSGGSPACQGLADALVRFVRGTATAGNRRQVEEHLSSCASCRAKLGELRETDAALWDRRAFTSIQAGKGDTGSREPARAGVRRKTLALAEKRIPRPSLPRGANDNGLPV